MSFVRELKRRNVFRVGTAYVVVGWLLIQVVETVLPLFGFDEYPARVVVVVVAAGFIPVVVIAWVYELTAEGLKKQKDIDVNPSTTHVTGRKLDFAIIGLLVVAIGYFGYDKFVLDPGRDAAATANALVNLAEVQTLVGDAKYAAAYARARETASSIADETLRQEMWELASTNADLNSEPQGAGIWARPYDSSEEDWEYLGTTPVDNARLPLGMVRLRLELDGYRTSHAAKLRGARTIRLDELGTVPDGMVRVEGAQFDVFMPGLEHLTIELSDFLIDENEVTNQHYKEFIDAGGYQDPNYWIQPFFHNGQEISFDDAMKLFTDRTGRPGPSTWEVGRYGDGEDQYPVAGVSWYEAAAYAVFMEKELPTLYHWYRAALPHASQFMLPHSNFGPEGPIRVGTTDGISPSGVNDMAGNVREWVWNQSDNGRFLLGGGAGDLEYMFTDANAQSPTDRDQLNGIRLMKPLDSTNLQFAREPISRAFRDYFAESPVEEDVFEIYRSFYTYDTTPLNAEIVDRIELGEWVREEIKIDAAYGDEQLTLLLHLPTAIEPPYPTIIFFPGSNVIRQPTIPAPGSFPLPFLMQSGYAVVLPIYKGTYSRGTELRSDIQNMSNSYREHVIQWYKDLARSLDYAETRPEMDMSRLGYLGVSWGSAMAPVMIAMEPKIKASVLLVGGLVLQPTQPEVDPFNFLPRATVPTRMVNLPNDYFYPEATSQEPFYQLLGARSKDRVVLEGGHGHRLPMNIIVKESLNWFEQYLPQRQ